MDRALLAGSLERWAASLKQIRSGLVQRADAPLLPTKELALALSGVRRCGKTSMAQQLSTSFDVAEVLYYNFEDPLFIDADGPNDLETIFSIFQQQHGQAPRLTILDEIQNVPGWERWLRSAIDQQRSSFIVTGSNSKLLGAELATSLTGRCLEHLVWPLSLGEALKFLANEKRGISTYEAPQNQDVRNVCIQALLHFGALPAVFWLKDDSVKEKLLRQYLSDIVHKDIINRRDIRNKRALDQILTYYLTNISSLHSYSAIKKAFSIPTDTVAEYTAALSEAYLVFEVERYHKNLKVQSRDPRKVYAIDSGLRRVAARSPEADIGKLLENMVYIELRRKAKTVHYYQDGSEVDFIISENYEPIEAIQVCAYGMDVNKTRQREVSSLFSCLPKLGLKQGLIITMDRNEVIENEGLTIESISIDKWLS